jgi:hypothetical protein
MGPPPVTFNVATRAAAKTAEEAAKITVDNYLHRYIVDEDDITGTFVGSLNTVFHGMQLGGVNFKASVVRHRSGKAAEESRIGADILIHAAMDTPTQKYSKGVLIQAKKADTEYDWSNKKRNVLIGQCEKMLNITPSAFVFNYSRRGIRCGAATRIAGATTAFSVDYLCGWSIYRFFLELFRCPIGDPRITSAHVGDLPEPDVPFIVKLSLEGELGIDAGSSVY